MKRTRCPNGSRKDKNGICVKKVLGETQITQERVNGTCKNKRECNKTTRKKRVSSDRQTPRSIYARKYFDNKKETIYLLDKIHDDTKRVLFQVNYNDVEQFLNYENLHHNPKIDCFFQTIFSLGLQDVKNLKKYSRQVNKHGKSGVDSNNIKLFIKDAFGLTDDEPVEFSIYQMTNHANHSKRSSEVISKKIHKKFNANLKNGYATIIYVERLYNNNTKSGHYIVMYKYNNQIYFFDPQKKTRKNVNGIFTSTNIQDVLIDRSGNIGYFTIDNLKSPKPLLNTTCPINYVG